MEVRGCERVRSAGSAHGANRTQRMVLRDTSRRLSGVVFLFHGGRDSTSPFTQAPDSMAYQSTRRRRDPQLYGCLALAHTWVTPIRPFGVGLCAPPRSNEVGLIF